MRADCILFSWAVCFWAIARFVVFLVLVQVFRGGLSVVAIFPVSFGGDVLLVGFGSFSVG